MLLYLLLTECPLGCLKLVDHILTVAHELPVSGVVVALVSLVAAEASEVLAGLAMQSSCFVHNFLAYLTLQLVYHCVLLGPFDCVFVC